MLKHKTNTKSGITLIALVVTIIVLLLLAGISIQMLTGDNGILTRAGQAKTMTDEAQIKERIQLAYHSALTKDITGKKGQLTMQTLQEELEKEFTGKTVTITESTDKKEWIIAVDNVELSVKAGKETTPPIATLPTGAGTKPYLPNEEVFSQVEGTDLTNGLVITDHKTEGVSDGNEYVWVEVPNAILGGGTPTFGPNYSAQGLTATEITDETIDANKGKIEEALIAYAETLLNGSIESSNSDIYKNSRMGWKDEFYEGCGVADSTTYNNMYKAMLKSVYNHGGFWIGRYEAGITEARTASGDIDASLKPLSKQNVYPLNYVTCSQAQTLAGRINNIDSKYNSSLMFGVQWDMVLKYLEKKATWNGNTESYYLTQDSSSWGEYMGTSLSTTIANAREFTYMTNSWGNVVNNTRSNYGGPVLSSTGSLIGTDKMNIFDLAGNEFEWTLEHATSNSGIPCSARGGGFTNTGSSYPASGRDDNSTTLSDNYSRFSCLTLLKRRPEA